MKTLSLRVSYGSIQSFLLALGIALLPVYVFGSGGIQPAHMLIALFAAITLLREGIPNLAWVSLLAVISVYSLFVESIYTILGGKPSSMLSGLFYFYNFIIASAIYLHCVRFGLSALLPGLLVSCVIAVATILITGISLKEGGQGRATGTFNNPNQLGYFSVCLLSLSFLLYRHKLFGYFTALFLFLVALFLSIASLSKAAMIANFLVVVFALKPVDSALRSKNENTLRSFIFWIVLLVVVSVSILFLFKAGFFESFLFVDRLAGIASEGDSSLGARGYFVFLEGNVFQVIFGMGSSLVSELHGHEVHSTLGSVINNYGFVGFFVVLGIMGIWIVDLLRAYGFIGTACIAGPAMLYGITHNGIRFTAFWVLLSSSIAMSHLIRSGRIE